MVKTESCALCFATKSKWFLDIFCDENQTVNISAIISKHLWFDVSIFAASPTIGRLGKVLLFFRH